MAVAVVDRASVDDHAAVQKGAVALLYRAQTVDEVGELCDVETVDAPDLVEVVLATLVVRDAVVPVGHADARIAAIASGSRVHQRRDTRDVSLEREHHQFAHQAQVLIELHALARPRRQLVRLLDRGPRCAARSPGDAPLELTQRGEVLVELATVRAPELLFEAAGILADEVENAEAVELATVGALIDLLLRSLREETVEDAARIRLLRHRCRRAGPRDVVRVGAAVSGVAVARVATGVAGEHQRGQTSERADLRGRRLVDGNAAADLRARGLVGLGAGEKHRGAARVVAGAIAVGASLVVRQTAEDEELVAHLLERAQRPRQLEVAALFRGEPVAHVDAVGHETEGHADRCPACCRGLSSAAERGTELGTGRRHHLQEGQRHGGAEASQNGPSGDLLVVHRLAPPPRRIRNGSVCTTARINSLIL